MIQRRAFICLIAAAAAGLLFWSREKTPLPSHIRVAPLSEPGTRLIVEGKVLDARGRGVAGVTIRVHHTDATGHYGPTPTEPRLRGVLHTAADGSYEIDTIMPGKYPGGQARAHMHFLIEAPGHLPFPETIFFDHPVSRCRKDFHV